MKHLYYTGLYVLIILSLITCSRETPINCRAKNGLSGVDRIKDHLSREEKDGFSGAILVADSLGIILNAEYGEATKEPGPTAFWIASISKAVTAVTTMDLVEEGKLSLNEPLSTYLKGVPEQWEDVTVHHLLAHRSGLPHAYAVDGITDRSKALDKLMTQQPVKEIGQFTYSNDGYNILAILIELVSGEPFETYVSENVFDPAGMDNSGFWGFQPDTSHVAPPNEISKTKQMSSTIWKNGRSIPNWGYRGASGIYSTVEDLYHFITSLRNGNILSDDAFNKMISSKNPSIGPNGQTYGYGWAIRLRNGDVVEYWHGGNEDWLGHNGMLKVVGGRTYVVLTNSGDLRSGSWAHRIEKGIRACIEN